MYLEVAKLKDWTAILTDELSTEVTGGSDETQVTAGTVIKRGIYFSLVNKFIPYNSIFQSLSLSLC